MLTLNINGQTITTPAGVTVLEAARQNGIVIPTLCHHPALKPAGACRLCVVEIEGMRGEPTSCTTPVADGMIVRTDTPTLRDLRRQVLSLILSEHPYTCLVCERHERCSDWQTTIRKASVTTGCENCPKNGQCELQTLVDDTGLGQMIYPISYRGLPVEKDDPFFDRDYNLCILCGRCVRVCQDVRQTGTLAFTHRGAHALVGTAFGQSHLAVDCEFCGSCVDVCPVGALYDKRTKWEGPPERTMTTICPYCSVGCQLDLWVKRGKVIGVRPTPNGQVNAGQACVRGRFGIVEMIHAPDRLRSPLVRKQGRLVEVPWQEALQTAADALRSYQGSSFAMLLSPHLPNEPAYLMQKFARQVMGSSFVDCPTALPRIPAVAELAGLLRANHRGPLRAVREASCILVLGTNPRRSHPVAALYIRQAIAAGARLVVVDPRRTELARRADIWLPVDPGKDAQLLKRLSVTDDTARSLHSSGAGEAIRTAAHLLHSHIPVTILYGSGVTDYPSAPETLQAIYELADSLEPRASVIPLVGAANTLGVLAAGAVAISPQYNYAAIVNSIQARQVKALYLAGGIPLLDELANLDLLIVQDTFLSSNVAEFASVVFPAASFAEISGTLTNLEGQVQRFDPVIPPVGESRPDWWIVSELARALGAQGFNYQHSADISAEIETLPLLRVPDPLPRRKAPRRPSGFTFTLITERNPLSYRSSALTDRVRGMELIGNEEFVLLNPSDAAHLGIADDDLVRLVSAHGKDTLLARLSGDLPPGIAFASINNAYGSPLFPAKLPDVKACSVNIERAE